VIDATVVQFDLNCLNLVQFWLNFRDCAKTAQYEKVKKMVIF